jgi:hypothetical protein
MQADTGLESLLDLNGYTIDQEGGYWVKVEAWRVPITVDIPHGIRYSLTLHEPYGKRILGSPGLGLYSPLAMASMRSRIFSWVMIPMAIFFISLLPLIRDPLP